MINCSQFKVVTCGCFQTLDSNLENLLQKKVGVLFRNTFLSTVNNSYSNSGHMKLLKQQLWRIFCCYL